jgi:hypothetical protein
MRRVRWLAPLHGGRPDDAASQLPPLEDSVGRFLLGFLVAIILVIFVVVQCAQTLF